MIATNHYLAGVAAATALGNPWYAFPAAFASHFILDAVPHFGMEYSKDRSKILLAVAALDVLLLMAAAVIVAPKYPAWFSLAGFVAFSPDIAWIYRFIFKEKFGQLPPTQGNSFNTWHSHLQKLENPWGAVVEIGFLVAFFGALSGGL